MLHFLPRTFCTRTTRHPVCCVCVALCVEALNVNQLAGDCHFDPQIPKCQLA